MPASLMFPDLGSVEAEAGEVFREARASLKRRLRCAFPVLSPLQVWVRPKQNLGRFSGEVFTASPVVKFSCRNGIGEGLDLREKLGMLVEQRHQHQRGVARGCAVVGAVVRI